MNVQAKLTIVACITACVFAVAIPLVSEATYESDASRAPTTAPDTAESSVGTAADTLLTPTDTSPPAEEAPPEEERAPIDLTVYLHKEGTTTTMSLEDYIVCVVAAEMPSTFHIEALKAQAVAARTYCFYKKNGTSHEGGAEVCTDHTHCAAYTSEEALVERYGQSTANQILEKIREAVTSTAGQIITYEGKPALAVFHSRSYQYTESSKNIWGGDVPYLVSVPTYEEDSISTVKVTKEQMASLFASVATPVAGGLDLPTLRSEINNTGRQDRLYYGDRVLAAKNFRTYLGFRSCSFTYEETEDGWLFTVHGYGHGVGMSQYGANHMAKNGYTYDKILTHYYTGVTLEAIA